MNVTLRQLRAFVAVAEVHHFTRAADKLQLSQSTVSTMVRELEDNLGLRLFDRHTRMLRLTQAGSEILPLARKALADLDSVIGSSNQLRTLGRGRVSIAASSLQAALMLPHLLRQYALQYPGVKINLYDVTQLEVPELVRGGEVDLGIGTESGTRHDLLARVLTHDTFVAVMLTNHPLARKREVTWRDLKDAPLLGPRQGNPLREQLDFALAGEGITLTNVFEISVPLTILGMVENGMGIGVLTSTGSRLAVAMGLAVRKIAGPVIKRDISLLVHAERSLSPAAQNLRDLLIERRAELAPA